MPPRSWILAFTAILVVLGIAIPVFVTLQVDTRDEVPNLEATFTEEEQRGRQVFGQRCVSCHTLEAAGASAKVGPNLDELRPPAALVLNAIEEGRARGNGQMPPELVSGPDAEAVAAFVAKATGAAGVEQD